MLLLRGRNGAKFLRQADTGVTGKQTCTHRAPRNDGSPTRWKSSYVIPTPYYFQNPSLIAVIYSGRSSRSVTPAKGFHNVSTRVLKSKSSKRLRSTLLTARRGWRGWERNVINRPPNAFCHRPSFNKRIHPSIIGLPIRYLEGIP